MRIDYDIIIVGGGMVGLAFAARLKNSALKIAIVEHSPVQNDWPQGEYDLRVSAISRASENLFRQIGAWQNIDESQKSSYQNMRVWDGESTQGLIEFDASLIGEANIGHIIENRVLRKSLFQTVHSANNIDWLCPEKCLSVNYHTDFAELELASQTIINAKLLVAADGAFSWLRQTSKIELDSKAYQQQALVCTVKTEKPHQSTAYQRFDKNGPLAFLPLKDSHHCSIVWSQDEAKAKKLKAMSPQEFQKQLEQHFEQHLGAVEVVSPLVSFPLFERTASQMCAHRLALIGDAAHTIHPLAGQGVNLGFADALQLAEQIEQKIAKQQDIGLHESLRAYQRARKGDVWLMQQAMMGLKKLFASTNPALQMLRSQGLSQLQQHSIIKQKMIQKAMGL